MKSAADRLAPLLAVLLATAAHAQTMGPEADYPVTIGDPYSIGGTTFTPVDTLNYDAVGMAHAGLDGSGISGAHHTLPVPCYVEVTALGSGRTILVRLDRRGPMNGKALIELSPAAWAQLGLGSGGDAPVRVRRVNPPEPERALLRKGARAPERMDTPPGLLAALRRKLGTAAPQAADAPPAVQLAGGPPSRALPATPPAPKPAPNAAKLAAAAVAKPEPAPPKPAPTPAPKPEAPKPVASKPAPTPAAKHLVVQVAAFAERAHADKAAKAVGGTVEPAGRLYRVRISAGSEDEARAALAKAHAAGYAGALIVHHD